MHRRLKITLCKFFVVVARKLKPSCVKRQSWRMMVKYLNLPKTAQMLAVSYQLTKGKENVNSQHNLIFLWKVLFVYFCNIILLAFFCHKNWNHSCKISHNLQLPSILLQIQLNLIKTIWMGFLKFVSSSPLELLVIDWTCNIYNLSVPESMNKLYLKKYQYIFFQLSLTSLSV